MTNSPGQTYRQFVLRQINHWNVHTKPYLYLYLYRLVCDLHVFEKNLNPAEHFHTNQLLHLKIPWTFTFTLVCSGNCVTLARAFPTIVECPSLRLLPRALYVTEVLYFDWVVVLLFTGKRAGKNVQLVTLFWKKGEENEKKKKNLLQDGDGELLVHWKTIGAPEWEWSLFVRSGVFFLHGLLDTD